MFMDEWMSKTEGNGTPLQYCCLENPMDGGAWWAAVHGVAKSRTRLGTSLSLFTFMHWRRIGQPTPVFLPGESQGWGSLVGCHLWGHTESDTTEATSQQQHTHKGVLFGHKQETPWHAAQHGVTLRTWCWVAQASLKKTNSAWVH